MDFLGCKPGAPQGLVHDQAFLLAHMPSRLGIPEVLCVALNQFINVAVAEKLSALRVERYFQERAARADVPGALGILERAGKSKPPVEGDELAK